MPLINHEQKRTYSVFQAVASSLNDYIADISDVEPCTAGISHLKTALKTSPAIYRSCVFSRDESAFIAGMYFYEGIPSTYIFRSKITIGVSHQVIQSQFKKHRMSLGKKARVRTVACYYRHTTTVPVHLLQCCQRSARKSGQ
jgi:hypothetical protein